MRREVRRRDPELVVTADLGASGYGLFVHMMGLGRENAFALGGRGPGMRLGLPLALALGSVALIGLVDSTTGTEASMSALYIVVVLASSWFLGWRPAAAVAVLASAIGLAANHPAFFGPPGAPDVAVYWNWASRLVAQLGIVYVIGRSSGARMRREG